MVCLIFLQKLKFRKCETQTFKSAMAIVSPCQQVRQLAKLELKKMICDE